MPMERIGSPRSSASRRTNRKAALASASRRGATTISPRTASPRPPITQVMEVVTKMILSSETFKTTIVLYKTESTASEKYYMTKTVTFDDYYETKWSHRFDSFIQSMPNIALEMHSKVNQYIRDFVKGIKCSFIGIGGEAGYYAFVNRNQFRTIKLYTNNEDSYNDDLDNFNNDRNVCHLINYKTADLSMYLKVDDSVLINLSIKNVHQLIKQVVDSPTKFLTVIYIGCDERYIREYTQMLSTRYTISIGIPCASSTRC